eukprot:TRINITY_DN32647_c0_g1_i1.p1 TRINITY_DN32647_c0_g1~~TRINITY_DN32647_c0_g1_i1.p1  ORF type:complete len:809 (-),score=166.18 TRINITY_DN32647_c0_g1_i1:113-2539(-)
MLLRILLVSLAVLAVVYLLKASLLQLAGPGASLLGSADDLAQGLTSETHKAVNLTDLEHAQEFFRTGDDDKAVVHLQSCLDDEKARQSQRDACRTALGEFHMVGAGVPRNLTRAKELFEASAESSGDPEAQFNLAILYGSSQQGTDDLHRNEAMAVLHLYAASTGGHTGALMAMGYRHLHGYGVPQACTTAALNYIDVAKRIANVYSSGMPQAVELIRLNLHHKDRKIISSSELNLFVQIATSGDSTVAAAIGKRYLLGIEGFKQDYQKAKYYLRMAANRQHSGALALLGYMHCLGLGTKVDLETSYAYFVTAASQNDPLGHNGLGFIYFKGTNAQARNWRLAFKHFNESAFGGSSDGMFNLASMYLTGTGTEQSFQKAVLYYTQALDRGHTPAAYSLAVMHLNGIGTVRDCDIAVNLLKKVCERGEWVSSKLVSAYEFGEKAPDKAALLFLKLAEAGHEVAQMNAAHLFDSGQSTLLLPDETEGTMPAQESSAEAAGIDARSQGRNLAQRFYELSAEQGSASSELRLGDYAYYGWGMSATFGEGGKASSLRGGDEQEESAPPSTPTMPSAAKEEEDADDFPLPSIYTNDRIMVQAQAVDYEASLARYRKTAEMTVTGEWMQSFVARASFNLGFMHEFGIGISQDMHMAKQHYFRCREVDPSGLHAPVTMALAALAGHVVYQRLPTRELLAERLLQDMRVHILLMHLSAVVVLGALHCVLSSRRRMHTRPARPASSTQVAPQLQPQPQPQLQPQPQPQRVVPQPQSQPASPTAVASAGASAGQSDESGDGPRPTAGENRRISGNLVLD